MRLVKKTNRYYFFFSVIGFSIASIVLYFVLKIIIVHEVDEMLELSSVIVASHIEMGKDVTGFYPVLEIKEISDMGSELNMLRNVQMFDSIENEMELFRELSQNKSINGKNYIITVRHSIIEFHDYLLAIFSSIFFVLLFLFVGLNFLNRVVSRKMWDTFYKNLYVLKNFSIGKDEGVSLYPSDIDEFEELNKVVYNLTNKINRDYQLLKEFTENASHEIQTPLAIIQSKLELLIQEDNLTNSQADLINSINTSISKLTKLNRSLLLLAKIENQQFSDFSDINCSNLIQQQLTISDDFGVHKKLTISTKIENDVLVQGNKILSEILFSNLINNSIKHNVNNGIIEVLLTQDSFIISNSGKNPGFNPEVFFNRFKKYSNSIDSVGLGLSIVKKICDVHNWDICYTYSNSRHVLEIIF